MFSTSSYSNHDLDRDKKFLIQLIRCGLDPLLYIKPALKLVINSVKVDKMTDQHRQALRDLYVSGQYDCQKHSILAEIIPKCSKVHDLAYWLTAEWDKGSIWTYFQVPHWEEEINKDPSKFLDIIRLNIPQEIEYEWGECNYDSMDRCNCGYTCNAERRYEVSSKPKFTVAHVIKARYLPRCRHPEKFPMEAIK